MRVAHDSVPAWIDPMLAKPDGGRLRAGPQWAYEYKLDGYRVALRIAAEGTTVLTSRNDIDLTAEFAELAGVLASALRGRAAVLDGEVVVYNEAGQIDFGLLQQRRGRFQKHRTARRAETFTEVPVRFLAFDLLQLGEQLMLDKILGIRQLLGSWSGVLRRLSSRAPGGRYTRTSPPREEALFRVRATWPHAT